MCMLIWPHLLVVVPASKFVEGAGARKILGDKKVNKTAHEAHKNVPLIFYAEIV